MSDRPSKPAKARKSRGRPRPESVRDQAVLALLSETSILAAAERCGVHERTLRKWLAEDPDFQRAVTTARHDVYQAGMRRVLALTGAAIETLAKLLDPEVNAGVRLGAARTLAELASHQVDAETIMAKLDAIEANQRNG